MAIKKHKLEYKEDFDFLLLGLATPENDYRLVWKINNNLSLDLEKSENHKLLSKSSETGASFSQYTYDDQDTFLHYRLLSNKTETASLLDEMKNIDFLLIVQGEFSESFAASLVSKLKNIENIHGVFRIPAGSLRNKERLLT